MSESSITTSEINKLMVELRKRHPDYFYSASHTLILKVASLSLFF